MTVRRIPPEERRPGASTPGMEREEAVAGDGFWAGLVRSGPRTISGWHHHGDHDTAAYVLTGTLRVEFGAGGRDAVEAGAGDFLHIPKRVVHREGNPGDAEATLVVVRGGRGEPVFNVDGPDPDR